MAFTVTANDSTGFGISLAAGTNEVDVTDTFSVSLTDTAELYVTQERTGLGPFSRPSLNGTSQQLYGSFAGKVGEAFAVDVTDTLSVAVTESVENFVTSSVTDTLSVDVTEAVEMFKAIAVTDTLSVDAGDVAAVDAVYQEKTATDTLSVTLTDVAELLEFEDKTATDTLSVALTDNAAVEATDAPEDAQAESVGGYRADILRQRKRKRKADDDEPPPAAPPPDAPPNRDLELTRQLVAYWSGEADRSILTRRAQRALDYALRAETVLAMQLFERELAKQLEEEELALMLFVLDD